MSRRFLVSLLGFVLSVCGLALGCDDVPTAPPPPDPDTSRQCADDGTGCPSEQVCVQGRCYAQCTEDSDCGPRERCGSAGACERSDAPEPDAGVTTDSGPADPCDSVSCPDGEVCHPFSHECVACREAEVGLVGAPGNCGEVADTVCDIANGNCVAPVQAQCAPCNVEGSCTNTDMTFIGACVQRSVMDWREQVCLQVCDAETACPDGLACSDDGYCEPRLGISCTTWIAATTRAMCLSDGDCNIRGASGRSIFFTETCEGEMVPMVADGGSDDGGLTDAGVPPDAGPTVPGRCLQPCAVDSDCFGAAQTCADTGRGLTFCADPARLGPARR